MDNNKIKELFLNCSCLSEGLKCEIDSEYKEVNLAYFNIGFIGNKLTWRQKFRFIWQCLKGRPYCDMIILDYKKSRELAIFLMKNTKD